MKQLMIVGAALVACGNLFGAIRAVTPDNYGGNANAWQMKRHAEGYKNIWLPAVLPYFQKICGK